MSTTKAEQIQLEYYSQIANNYEKMCVHENDAHSEALKYISKFVELLNISSILDVGCGTGRGVKYFLDKHPKLKVNGIDPSKALIEQAINENGILSELIIHGNGKSLPFEENSFDAVCEFGILHHVKEHKLVVSEMIRVAKKAVFISDSNRFAQGNLTIRLLKLVLYKLNLWKIANFIKTKGKGYDLSEGDGLAYSYSVYDSYDVLASWADQIILIPTSNQITKSKTWFHPLLTSDHILVCAFKKN